MDAESFIQDSRSSRSNSPQNESTDSNSDEQGRARGRGRGRARGRGRDNPRRGRGRGPRRGRGTIQAAGPNRAEVAATTIEERNRKMEERIDRMSEESAKDYLRRFVKDHPSYAFDVIDHDDTQHGGHHPPQDSPSPDWCTCTYCREMPTEAERRCCGRASQNCYSRLPDFYLIVLDEAVLHVARRLREELLVMPQDEDFNRANRFASYRQFIVWVHGRLGAGDRRVIPSCCVWRIRDKYPNPFGQYKGFVGGRFN
ncbi:uncharacterized protein [Mytilus edulis]|uniref:uncharacterized protein n=1 Tax=Mytilus edulis TaxID=6550 RepID=UPI0039EEDB3B